MERPYKVVRVRTAYFSLKNPKNLRNERVPEYNQITIAERL